VIDEIRTIPGYERFLDQPSFDDIVDMAGHTPLVYVAASQSWGSAFVVNPNRPPPVLLPGLSSQPVERRVRAYLDAYAWRLERPGEWREALDRMTGWLWDTVVGPLLEALSSLDAVYLQRGTRGEPPAVVLVPFGPLALLPIHAAWTPDSTAPSGRRYALDELRISYAPNARAIAEAREVAASTKARNLLAVEEPLPVSAARLPQANAEVAAAQRAFRRTRTLRHEEATRASTLAHMGSHAVVHLACHGQARLDRPLDSYLLFAYDERLTLRELLARRFGGTRLAVLSACETAIVGDELPDEVLSLPSGLLQAGFGGVVGAMWSVPDASTALLLTRFYELWRNGPGMAPAEALRRAQAWMRDTSNGDKLEQHPALMADAAERVPANALRFWEQRHGHRHPYHWAGFAYMGA
jgi:hypothetical protein